MEKWENNLFLNNFCIRDQNITNRIAGKKQFDSIV